MKKKSYKSDSESTTFKTQQKDKWLAPKLVLLESEDTQGAPANSDGESCTGDGICGGTGAGIDPS